MEKESGLPFTWGLGLRVGGSWDLVSRLLMGIVGVAI